MSMETVRAKLGEWNLSELARRAGVSVRALRRFKNVPGAGLHATTLEAVQRAMRSTRKKVGSADAA